MPAVIPLGDEVYREEINLPLMRWLMSFFMVFGLVFMLLVFTDEAVSGPPKLVSVILSVVFLGVGWLVSNFLKFTVTVTPSTVNLSSGRFRTSIDITDIQESRHSNSRFLLLGGWGLRIAPFRDGWVKAYIFGRSKLDLVMKRGAFRHIIFSTENPRRLAEIIREMQVYGPRYV